MRHVSSKETATFVDALDAAMEAHMDWTRRVLRCAVTRELPGEDVLRIDAHCACRFGRFLKEQRSVFDKLDPDGTMTMHEAHREMHDAIRRICECVLQGKTGCESDLTVFESTQRRLLKSLASMKTLALTLGAHKDHLTGLPTRFSIESDFRRYRRDAGRRGELLYLVMVDIDHFKSINDRYGHAAGDKALGAFARGLRSAFRENDLVYRFGGEEFMILMRCGARCELSGAMQRILGAIRRIRVRVDAATIPVRATAGIYAVRERDRLTTAIHMADLALYAGKRAGRDQCVVISKEQGRQHLVHSDGSEFGDDPPQADRAGQAA